MAALTVHPHACGGYAKLPPVSSAPPGHPHACGGYEDTMFDLANYCGSPPRMWGICCLPAIQHRHRSGSPPRMWGILRLQAWVCSALIGSPPRMWGICIKIAAGLTLTAVHPHACGGYGRWGHTAFAAYTVHPHACGGYIRHMEPHSHIHRFTPTHVGDMQPITK